MTRASFLAARRPRWQHFERLLGRADAGALSGDEAAAFSPLFRGLCHDLAIVRSRGWGRDLDRYVNDLVVRGHARLYRTARLPGQEVVQFLLSGFPRLLRRHAAYAWVAAALFVVPTVVAGLLVAEDPSRAVYVLPGTTLEQFEGMYAKPAEGSGAPLGMAGFYVWNNAGLAFRCFATGVFFGAGSIFYLVYNGVFFGALAGYLSALGHGHRLFSFVVGHGALELTAIVVAGAAGLLLGHGLVHPAPYTWGESVRRRGRTAVQLALGSGAMLIAAAAVEAGWSPLPLPEEVKYVAGALLWLLVGAYFALAGRRPEGRAP